MQAKDLISQLMEDVDAAFDVHQRNKRRELLKTLTSINEGFTSDAEWAGAVVGDVGPGNAYDAFKELAEECLHMIRLQAIYLQLEIKERAATKGEAQ